MQPGSIKSTVKRGAKRANYDRDQINDILDSSYLCHVGFTVDGEARVLPTAYVRVDDALYFHGHRKNLMLQTLLQGQTACVTVTCLDGMVLARSGFHHSVNYRSAVLFGRAQPVPKAEKESVLDALIDHFVAGQSRYVRPYDSQELEATSVVKFMIDEASAKIRSGPPVDNEKDYETDIWAGVLHLETVVRDIQPCPRLPEGVPVPAHILDYKGNTS